MGCIPNTYSMRTINSKILYPKTKMFYNVLNKLIRNSLIINILIDIILIQNNYTIYIYKSLAHRYTL